jgi:hypothetical protein
MRARLVLALVLSTAALPRPAWPQAGELVPPTFRTQFAIPDAPAFELLSVDPGTILRPQTPRDLAVALSGFQSADGSLSVPRAFAVEFSPGILVGGRRMTQETYDRHRLLYATRLSLATLRAGSGEGTTRIAIGARLSLADRAGYGTDESFPPELRVQPAIDAVHTVYANARARAVTAPENRGRRPNEITALLDPAEKAEVEERKREIARIWADRYWNVGRWDVAIAARVRTADSLGHDPRFDAVSLWSSWSRGFGTWGQLLVGVRAGSSRDSLQNAYRGEGSASARFYTGSNRAKAFIEGQYSWRASREPDAFLNSGCELAAADWIWLELHAGLERLPGGEARLSTSFRLKTAVPGT